jgi:hypothetical protein
MKLRVLHVVAAMALVAGCAVTPTTPPATATPSSATSATDRPSSSVIASAPAGATSPAERAAIADPAHSVISTGADGLRTFSVIREVNGYSVACAAYGLADPLVGTFEGRAGAREPVWIRAADGRHLSVVWPEGFRVRFEPTAVLYNEQGTAVAKAGGRIVLGQIRPEDHAGTFEDPYIASGILFGRCYPFAL